MTGGGTAASVSAARSARHHPNSATRAIARRLTAAASAAGVDGRITGHSGRVGLAVELTRRGAPEQATAKAGGWKSSRMVAHSVAGRAGAARQHPVGLVPGRQKAGLSEPLECRLHPLPRCEAGDDPSSPLRLAPRCKVQRSPHLLVEHEQMLDALALGSEPGAPVEPIHSAVESLMRPTQGRRIRSGA